MKKISAIFLLFFSIELRAQFVPGAVPFDVFFASTQTSSKIKCTEADIEMLSTVRIAGLVFDYSRMSIGPYQNLNEYLINRKDLSQAEKEEWQYMFKEKFEPQFINLFISNALNQGVDLALAVDTLQTKVDLIIEILKVNPDRQNKSDANSTPPNISFVCTFLNIDGNVIARFISKGFGPNSKEVALRLGECYAVAGKMLAYEIRRSINKYNRKK